MILFFISYKSILFTFSSKTYFLISSIKALLLNFITIFLMIAIEYITQLCSKYNCHINLQFESSFYYYMPIFSKYMLIIYAIIILKLVFYCKFYTLQLLSYLYLGSYIIYRFYIFDVNIFNIFYLLVKYSNASFDLFIYKFQVFYNKCSILCGIYMLDIHEKPGSY